MADDSGVAVSSDTVRMSILGIPTPSRCAESCIWPWHCEQVGLRLVAAHMRTFTRPC